VSPLWRDQIRIVLSPRQVTLVRLARGWTPRIARKCVVPCDAAKPGEASWRRTLPALETALTEFGEHRADAVVVLSNHFVRYVLVGDSDQLGTEEEKMALVRHSFSTVYGAHADRWALRLNDGGGRNGTRIASAVDQEFLELLLARLETARLQVRSIQPYLMAAFNRWRRGFNGAAWFVLGEQGKLCLAKCQDDRCYAIKAMRIGDDWPHELAAFLEREKLLLGFDPAPADTVSEVPVFVFAPGYSEKSQPQEKELWP